MNYNEINEIVADIQNELKSEKITTSTLNLLDDLKNPNLAVDYTLKDKLYSLLNKTSTREDQLDLLNKVKKLLYITLPQKKYDVENLINEIIQEWNIPLDTNIKSKIIGNQSMTSSNLNKIIVEHVFNQVKNEDDDIVSKMLKERANDLLLKSKNKMIDEIYNKLDININENINNIINNVIENNEKKIIYDTEKEIQNKIAKDLPLHIEEAVSKLLNDNEIKTMIHNELEKQIRNENNFSSVVLKDTINKILNSELMKNSITELINEDIKNTIENDYKEIIKNKINDVINNSNLIPNETSNNVKNEIVEQKTKEIENKSEIVKDITENVNNTLNTTPNPIAASSKMMRYNYDKKLYDDSDVLVSNKYSVGGFFDWVGTAIDAVKTVTNIPIVKDLVKKIPVVGDVVSSITGDNNTNNQINIQNNDKNMNIQSDNIIYKGDTLYEENDLLENQGLKSNNNRFIALFKNKLLCIIDLSNNKKIWENVNEKQIDNGNFKLRVQQDGKLVTYTNNYPVWATIPWFNIYAYNNRKIYLKLQNDGNLVLYCSFDGDNNQPKPLWASGTNIASVGSRNLVDTIYNSLIPTGVSNSLFEGGYLYMGQSLHSPLKRFFLFFTETYDLILVDTRDNNKIVWNCIYEKTSWQPALKLKVQDDCKLVVYDRNDIPIWSSVPWIEVKGDLSPISLNIQDDGNIVLYTNIGSSNRKVAWASGSNDKVKKVGGDNIKKDKKKKYKKVGGSNEERLLELYDSKKFIEDQIKLEESKKIPENLWNNMLNNLSTFPIDLSKYNNEMDVDNNVSTNIDKTNIENKIDESKNKQLKTMPEVNEEDYKPLDKLYYNK